MASSRALATFSSDVRSGRTFVRFRFAKEDVTALVEDLNYATTPAVIQEAAQVREYGRKVLEYLKANFPSENRSPRAALLRKGRRYDTIAARKPLGLREGWRVSFYSAATVYGGQVSSGASLWGFYIGHKLAKSERIQTILKSLESGSRPYTIAPVTAEVLAFPAAYPPNGENVFAKRADIPARKGYAFLEKTEAYADNLLARHGSTLEDELQRIVEKGTRLKKLALGVTPSSGNVLDSMSDAASVGDALASQKNPLGAIRTLKRRVKTRKFNRPGG